MSISRKCIKIDKDWSVEYVEHILDMFVELGAKPYQWVKGGIKHQNLPTRTHPVWNYVGVGKDGTTKFRDMVEEFGSNVREISVTELAQNIAPKNLTSGSTFSVWQSASAPVIKDEKTFLDEIVPPPAVQQAVTEIIDSVFSDESGSKFKKEKTNMNLKTNKIRFFYKDGSTYDTPSLLEAGVAGKVLTYKAYSTKEGGPKQVTTTDVPLDDLAGYVTWTNEGEIKIHNVSKRGLILDDNNVIRARKGK